MIGEGHIRRVLATTKSLQEAADILGIDQATLWRKRKRFGIDSNTLLRAHIFLSKARLSFNTLTRGSPKIPRSRPSVYVSMSRQEASSIPRALATRGACSGRFYPDVGVQTTGGGCHRIRRYRDPRRQIVFRPVRFDPFLYRIDQFLGRGSEVAAGRVGGVISHLPRGRGRG